MNTRKGGWSEQSMLVRHYWPLPMLYCMVYLLALQCVAILTVLAPSNPYAGTGTSPSFTFTTDLALESLHGTVPPSLLGKFTWAGAWSKLSSVCHKVPLALCPLQKRVAKKPPPCNNLKDKSCFFLGSPIWKPRESSSSEFPNNSRQPPPRPRSRADSQRVGFSTSQGRPESLQSACKNKN